MSEASKLIHSWRSIRKYKPDPVPDELIVKVLLAGRRAPSWGNTQPWHFIVVREDEGRQLLEELSFGQKWTTEAPVNILCCGDVNAFLPKEQRRNLLQVVEDGALPGWDEKFLDEVVLTNAAFCPHLLGSKTVIARILEQLGIAYSFMAIEAMHHGLGICMQGAIGNKVTEALSETYQKVVEFFSLPDNVLLLTYLTMGYPNEEPRPRPRKPFDEVVSFDRYGQAIDRRLLERVVREMEAEKIDFDRNVLK